MPFAKHLPIPAACLDAKEVVNAWKDRLETLAVRDKDPISVILRSAGIPEDARSCVLFIFCEQTVDIAVLLDIETKSSQKMETLVVWFQRGVQPGTVANFSNILVYYDPEWDQRVPAYFRVRIVKVADVKNKEIGDMLNTVSSSVSSVAAIIKDPLASPLIQTSITAAKLLLTQNGNEVLMDYTVQFYSPDFVAQSADQGIAGLSRGSFIVLGSSKDYKDGAKYSQENFWSATSWQHQSFTGQVFRGPDAPPNDSQYTRVAVPFLSLNISTAESIVPKAVIERSLRLNRLLSEYSSGSRITDIRDLGEGLTNSIRAYSSLEKAKRFNRIKDIHELFGILRDAGIAPEDTSPIEKWLRKECGTKENALRAINSKPYEAEFSCEQSSR